MSRWRSFLVGFGLALLTAVIVLALLFVTIKLARAQEPPLTTVERTQGSCDGGEKVRVGDDYIKIARRVFNDGRRWRDIAKANPEVDPLNLKVGQCLRIRPDPPHDKLLATMLALLVREQIGRPLLDVGGGQVVPEFSPTFEAAVVDCVAMASTGFTHMDDSAGLDDVCAMNLMSAWRIASGASVVVSTSSIPP